MGYTNFYQQGIYKHPSLHYKWFRCVRDYVEKQWASSTINSELFLLCVKIFNPYFYVCILNII